jgi:hypothetical protein
VGDGGGSGLHRRCHLDLLPGHRGVRRLQQLLLGIGSGRFTATLSPERLAMLAIAMVDGLGIPLALGDPETSVDAATQDVLTALTALLQPSGDQR